MKRKNLGIPEDIHRSYKLYAAAHGTTIVELAVKALLQYAGDKGIAIRRRLKSS
jgi:hypothetical protein